MIQKEIRIFFTALMFLTRLPVPATTNHRPEYLEQSTRYFPLAGIVVGLLSTLAFAAGMYVSPALAVLLCMIAGIWITGAFHEDGFADVCDAFGGGWTKEKILDIMKDSRLGTFGTVGLVAILGLKFYLLLHLTLLTGTGPALSWQGLRSLLHPAGIIVAAHAVSRFMPLVVIQTHMYVYRQDASKSKPLASARPGLGSWALALVTALLPLVLLQWQYLAALPLMLLAVWRMARFFNRWIGGYTGDCLGAVQQVSEIVFLLCITVLHTYWL